ncbi:MAG: polysaccharide pyruvyl transferase family protein [Prevotellaceae bacterium]|jgi:hypothetical protein|nr:polysaccharide pyruvyl transferase family protein [Prevotellaceae bacterium]
MLKQIHFVSRIDNTNAGDIWSSPLWYYYHFFQQYNIVRHDIGDILWNKISKDDVVIIGGGGLINLSDVWNININKLFDTKATIIGWGIGFNTHYDMSYPNTYLDMNRFDLVGIRDFAHLSNLSYLPCVSAFLPDLKKKKNIKRKIGVIEHKDYPITSENLSCYEKINNSYTIQKITDFIASSEIIVTNTYHITYWAQLMCKKVIIVDKFSSKFDCFKHKPCFYSGNIEKDIENTIINENCYLEAVELNNIFFEKVKQITKTKIEKKASRIRCVCNKVKIVFWLNENKKKIYTNLVRYTIRVINKIMRILILF